MEDRFTLLIKVYGAGDAELVKLFLESAGIEVLVAQESLGKSLYPVTIGKLAEAKIFVRLEDEQRARDLLRELDEGKFVSNDDLENPTP